MDAKAAEEKLASAGIRPTAQRIAIAQFAFGRSDHPTADDIKKHLDARFAKASLATVYNTLEAFVAAGLLRAFKLPHTDRVVYDDNVAEHHHLIDVETGEVADVPASDVKVRGRLPAGFALESVEVVFRGRLSRPRRDS